MKVTDLSRACMEAQMGMTEFMLEYSGDNQAFFYDGMKVSGPEHSRVIGRVFEPHQGWHDEDPLLYLDGDEDEEYYLQYGTNDPIPASVLPRITRDYIKQIVK